MRGEPSSVNLKNPVAVIFLLFVAFPSPGAGQFAATRPMAAGPSSVTLIATLESLSVGVTPVAPVASIAGTAPSSSNTFAINTSWAVPANLTTIRTVCFLEGASPAEILENGLQRMAEIAGAEGDGSELRRLGLVVGLAPGVEGRTLYSQKAGETNQGFTRTDYLGLEMNVRSQPMGSTLQSRSLTILVQAL